MLLPTFQIKLTKFYNQIITKKKKITSGDNGKYYLYNSK